MIDVDGLTKVYARVRGNETKALDGVTFDVPGRSILGFLGPNGAGKATTIRIFATMLPPTAGPLVGGDRGHARPNEVVRLGRIDLATRKILAVHVTTLRPHMSSYLFRVKVARRCKYRSFAYVDGGPWHPKASGRAAFRTNGGPPPFGPRSNGGSASPRSGGRASAMAFRIGPRRDPS